MSGPKQGGIRPGPPPEPEPEEYSDYEDFYDEEEDDEECGLMPDGQCQLAGSEHCDFVCSWRDSEFFAGSAAWNKRHKRK